MFKLSSSRSDRVRTQHLYQYLYELRGFWPSSLLSTMSWRQWSMPLLWFAAVLSVVGQSTPITQCISSFTWVSSLRRLYSYHLTNCDSLLIRWDRLPALLHHIWSPRAVPVCFRYIFSLLNIG